MSSLISLDYYVSFKGELKLPPLDSRILKTSVFDPADTSSSTYWYCLCKQVQYFLHGGLVYVFLINLSAQTLGWRQSIKKLNTVDVRMLKLLLKANVNLNLILWIRDYSSHVVYAVWRIVSGYWILGGEPTISLQISDQSVVDKLTSCWALAAKANPENVYSNEYSGKSQPIYFFRE